MTFLQLFLYQVTDYWRAYETISRQLGLRLLKSTQTTSDIFVIGTNVLTIPRSLKMVSIPWWKREYVYFVDLHNERFRYKHIVRQIVGIFLSTRK